MRIFNSINKQRPKDNLKEFLTVKNETLTTADLYFYGDIVSDWWGAWTDADQYPEAIRDFLKEQEGKNLNIYINSGGGSVFAGLAIYNMLQRHKGLKTVYVDGMAASIASVIALAGDKIIVPSNAFLMVHKPWALCAGNAHDYDVYIKPYVNIKKLKEVIRNEDRKQHQSGVHSIRNVRRRPQEQGVFRRGLQNRRRVLRVAM